MKKSLLTLVSVMLTTASALALPTKPVISTSQYTPWAAEATGYLYNVEAGLFLTNGNWWGTHACGADNGSTSSDNYTSYEDIFLGKAKVSGNRFVIQEEDPRTLADGVTIVACFSLQNTKYGESKHLFCGGNLDDLWVDGGSGDNFKQWYVETNADNSFKLKFVDKGTFGFQKISENNHNAFLDPENDAYTTWALVSEDVFSSVIDQFNLYYVSQGLNNLVVSIEAMGIGKDLSDYKALLESDETTYDEYASAVKELAPFVSLGEAIAAAKALDSDHDWSEFVTIFDNRESTTEVLNNALTRINAFISLKKKLNESIAKYPALDFSAPKAVYDDPASDNADLTEAIDDIDKIIIDGEIDNASLDNPVNITSQIPHVYDGYEEKSEVPVDWKRIFIGSGSTGSLRINTWSTEATEDGMVTPFIENWTGAGGVLSDQKVYRDTVEVRPGAYKITVKGRLFNESQGATYLKGANVFANINRKSITKEGIEGPENAIDGAKYANFNGKLYYYKDDFEGYGVVGSDGKLIFGMYIKDANCNWLAHKNYQVYYLGDSFESLDYVRQNTTLLADAYDEEVVAQKSLVGEYNAAIASYNAATDAASIISASAKIAELQDSVANNIAAYKAYTDRLDFISNYMGNEGATLEGPEVDLLTDYLDGDEGPCDEYPNGFSHYILDQLTLNTPEIKAELEFLNQLFNSALENGMSEGTDVTNLLVNPSFADGFKGWTSSTGGNVAGNIGFGTVEVFGGVVDCQQTVKAKPGIYAISVKAFERPGDNGSYTGTEDAKVFVFMNKFKNPVMNIVGDALNPDEAVNKTNCFIDNGGTAIGAWPLDYALPATIEGKEGYYVPNSMEGASYAFGADRYINTCYGLVEEGEDMTIGVTSNGVGVHWVLWADFKLTYMGKNADAVAAVLEAKLDEYSTYVDEQKNNELINSKEQDLAGDATDNADKALGEGDADKMWDALIAINDAYTHTQEHVAIMTELKDNIDNLSNAIDEYSETASAAAVIKANEILGTDYDELNNEELSTLSASAKDAITELKIPDTEGASDTNPIDMTQTIENNSFETGNITGWTYNTAATGDTGVKSNSTETYTISNADGSYLFNTWHGSALEGGFWLAQTVKALPAGTYELNALIASDAKNKIVVTAANGGAEYELETPKGEATEASIIFELEENEDLEIKVSSASWFKADYFRLKYFGTNSTQKPTEVDGIEVAEGAQIVAIYTVSGAPVASLQKGLNIVKYADGSVKKIFVK